MDKTKFPPVTWISLVGTFGSYLLPLLLGDGFSTREVLLITFFSSLVFLIIFTATVYATLMEFQFKIKCVEHDLESQKLSLSILKEQTEFFQIENKNQRSLVEKAIYQEVHEKL